MESANQKSFKHRKPLKMPNVTRLDRGGRGRPPAALIKSYQTCLQAGSKETLREIVQRLVSFKVSREQLLRWANQEGLSNKSISKRLSEVFCSMGLRARKAGAGRHIAPESLVILSFATARYGKRAPKLLRGACRAAYALASCKDVDANSGTGIAAAKEAFYLPEEDLSNRASFNKFPDRADTLLNRKTDGSASRPPP